MAITTSEAYKLAIVATSRISKVDGTITLNDSSTVDIEMSGVKTGSFYIKNHNVTDGSIYFGSTVAAEVGLSVNLSSISRNQLTGGKLTITAYIDVGDGVYEGITFTDLSISTAVLESNYYNIVCYDKMMDLAVDMTETTNLSGDLWYFLSYISSVCGVNLAQTETEIDAFTNATKNFTWITGATSTYKELLSYLCKWCACFAYINEDGNLKLKGFSTSTDFTLDNKLMKSTIKVSDYDVHFSDLSVTAANSTDLEYLEYTATDGTDELTYSMETNTITLDDDTEIQDAVDNIMAVLATITYTPTEMTYFGDLSIELGDRLEVTDTNGNVVETLVTSFEWKFRAGQTITSVGEDKTAVESSSYGVTEEVKQFVYTRVSTTAEGLSIEIGKKVSEDEIITKINASAEGITIDTTKLSITGIIEAINDDGTTTIDGPKITAGSITSEEIDVTELFATTLYATDFHIEGGSISVTTNDDSSFITLVGVDSNSKPSTLYLKPDMCRVEVTYDEYHWAFQYLSGGTIYSYDIDIGESPHAYYSWYSANGIEFHHTDVSNDITIDCTTTYALVTNNQGISIGGTSTFAKGVSWGTDVTNSYLSANGHVVIGNGCYYYCRNTSENTIPIMRIDSGNVVRIMDQTSYAYGFTIGSTSGNTSLWLRANGIIYLDPASSVRLTHNTYLNSVDASGAECHLLFVANTNNGYIFNTTSNQLNQIYMGASDNSVGITLRTSVLTLNGSLYFPNSKFIYMKDTSGTNYGMVYVNSSNSFVLGNCGSNTLYIGSSSGAAMYIRCSGTVTVQSSFTVTGTKNRAVQLADGTWVLLGAYETPTPFFGDIGSSEVGSDGIIEITIEDIFGQTIDISDGFKVFITPTSKFTESWWIEKLESSFVVHGQSGMTFDWELKAPQLGYADRRLEEFEMGEDEVEIDTAA